MQQQRKGVAAVFFPADHMPEDFDLMALAMRAQRNGARLYSNGRQHALFQRAPKSGGWKQVQTCAA